MKRLKGKGKIWSLRRLVRKGQCPSAFVLWLTLEDLAAAAGRKTITPTHDILAAHSGIVRRSTISTALTVLHNAGWIRCSVFKTGPKWASYLKIKLRRKPGRVAAAKLKKPARAPLPLHPRLASPIPEWQVILNRLFVTQGLDFALRLRGTGFEIPSGGSTFIVSFATQADLDAALPYKEYLLGPASDAFKMDIREVVFKLEEHRAGLDNAAPDAGRQPAPDGLPVVRESGGLPASFGGHELRPHLP